MSRKKKKRRLEDAPPESPAGRMASAVSSEATRAGEPEPNDTEESRGPQWSQRDTAPPAAEPERKPASWVFAGRPAAGVPVADSPEAGPAAAIASDAPQSDEPARAQPGFFARLAGWWRNLTGPGESVELRAEPGAPPVQISNEPVGEVAEAGAPSPPPTPRRDFTGPVDDDPASTLESSLRLAADLEHLSEKLQHREKHLASLREQRNELHHQLSRERDAAEGRIHTLEEELTGLRSHADEPAPQLQEALDASAARIHALEAELAQTRDNATTAQAALAAQESRLRALEEEIARMNPPIEEALEQLRLEKEATLHRVHSLEADLGATREQVAAATALTHALESELNAARERAESAEGRAVALEAELGQRQAELERSRAELERTRAELDSARAAASEMAARAEAAAAPPAELLAELDDERRRAQELGQKVEELARQLVAAGKEQDGARFQGERDLGQSQQESHRALLQVRDLEAALQQAQQLAQQREAELVSVRRQLESAEAKVEEPRPASKRDQAGPSPAASTEASAQVVAELYKQALTPLTVLVASADMLVMSLKDPSLKESAQDIKFQTQALMELLKKAAQPPEKK